MSEHHICGLPWNRRKISRAGGFKCEYKFLRRGGEGWRKREQERKEPLPDDKNFRP